MKWILLLVAGAFAAFWFDSSNEYSVKAHSMLDALFADKSDKDASNLPAPNVPLPPEHPSVVVALPSADTTISSKKDPFDPEDDTRHKHHSMDDMMNGDHPH